MSKELSTSTCHCFLKLCSSCKQFHLTSSCCSHKACRNSTYWFAQSKKLHSYFHLRCSLRHCQSLWDSKLSESKQCNGLVRKSQSSLQWMHLPGTKTMSSQLLSMKEDFYLDNRLLCNPFCHLCYHPKRSCNVSTTPSRYLNRLECNRRNHHSHSIRFLSKDGSVCHQLKHAQEETESWVWSKVWIQSTPKSFS